MSTPHSLPAADLSGVFAPADRGTALAGKLTRRPTPVAVGESPGWQEPGEVTPPVVRAEESPVRAVPRPRRTPPTIVYMAATVRDALREKARTDDTTQTVVVLDALDHAHENGLQGQPSAARPSGSLFQGRRQTGRRRGGARVQVGLTLVADDLQVVDRLVDESGFDSRTALVEAALREYLGV